MDEEKSQSPAGSAQAAAVSPAYTESTAAYDFLAWLDANRRNVALGVVMVVLLFASFGVYTWWKGETELKANAALLVVPGAALGADATNANPATFQKLAGDFPGTESAARSLLLAAHALHAQGKFAEAQAAYLKAGESSEFNSVKAAAAYGVAASLDAQGKTAEAQVKYADVANRYPLDGVSSLARLAQARIHEAAGRNDAALTLYDGIIRSMGSDVWAQDAQARRQELITRHPELVKTLPSVATPGAALPKPMSVAPGK